MKLTKGYTVQVATLNKKGEVNNTFIPYPNYFQVHKGLSQKVKAYLEEEYIVIKTGLDFFYTELESGNETVAITLLQNGEALAKEKFSV